MLFDPYALLPPVGWLFFSILATSAWSTLLRALNVGEKDYLASVAVTDSLSLLMFLIALLILGADFGQSAAFDAWEVPPIAWVMVFFGGLLYAGFIFFTFKGSQHVEGAVRPVLSQTQSIWAVAFALLFLGEALSVLKFIAILFIILGSALSVWRPNNRGFLQKGTKTILFASFLLGAVSVLDKAVLAHIPVLVYPIFTFMIPAVIFILLLGKGAPARIASVLRWQFGKCFLLSLFATLSFSTMLLALSKMDASIAIPISNTYVIFSSLGAIIFLSEKESWHIKLAGACIAFSGAVLLYM